MRRTERRTGAGRRRMVAGAAVAAALGLALGVLAGCGSGSPPTATPAASATPGTTADRDRQVAEHSAEVMPFDLSRASHTFDPTADGLVETVTTSEPPDPAQVDLIRGHLAAEARAFAAGDFADPARIHGDQMPGLAVLRSSAGRLTAAYADVPAGGRITYTGADPAVVDALHRFGAAQSMDHGHHGS